MYIDAAGLAGEAKGLAAVPGVEPPKAPLAGKPLGTERICELVKRRLKDAGLPSRRSPQWFRVTGITDLVSWGSTGTHGGQQGRS